MAQMKTLNGYEIVDQAVRDKLKKDLLWTNASSTSEFANQTININLSNYNGYIVEFKYSTTNDKILQVTQYHLNNSRTPSYNYGGEMKNVYRDIVYSSSNNTLGFSDCIQITGVSSVATNNSALIPLRIYGMGKLL